MSSSGVSPTGGIRRQRFHESPSPEQLHRLGLDIAPTTLVNAASRRTTTGGDAKALTLSAKLLILDETPPPLLAVRRPSGSSLRSINCANRVSFIYISHRLEEIARIADRVAVLRDGRLVATHPTAQVPENVLLENMQGLPPDRIFPKIENLRKKRS